MDQHGEKEAENKSQDSAEDDHTAADTSAEESTDRHAGYKATESAGALLKEVAAGGEESSSSPAALILAHPCSLLQLLLRACAGCLGLHRGDDPKPAAVAATLDDDDAADPAEEGDGGDKANYLYMVVTRVLAVRRPSPPANQPREGAGGNGGVHH